jgi:hypothetical protein
MSLLFLFQETKGLGGLPFLPRNKYPVADNFAEKLGFLQKSE